MRSTGRDTANSDRSSTQSWLTPLQPDEKAAGGEFATRPADVWFHCTAAVVVVARWPWRASCSNCGCRCGVRWPACEPGTRLRCWRCARWRRWWRCRRGGCCWRTRPPPCCRHSASCPPPRRPPTRPPDSPPSPTTPCWRRRRRRRCSPPTTTQRPAATAARYRRCCWTMTAPPACADGRTTSR